ncbi:26S proteasome non-ATPase regulatory subunit 13-like [Tubulanus polymorphus]|uniref:26S proteasome non-ATPase regulatory subunit 13-like n=1 Tax=Tubulanus polymorphus TaxID=672921 RepID=UPI003DA456FB
MATTRNVAGFLAERQTQCSPSVAAIWGELEDLYNKKLWHQLTLRLVEVVKNNEFAGDGLVSMYDNFLADFDHRINPLSLVEIALFIARQIPDPTATIEFLEKIRDKVKTNEEASILCQTSIANVHLQQKDLEKTKVLVESVGKLVEGLDGVTPVHGRYYELSSNYHKLMGDHAAYYRDALRYLGCTELRDIAAEERTERAFNLALAALLGKGVYNFGELLAHDILKDLKGGSSQWLVDLLFIFNSGNVAKFISQKSVWTKQADLAKAENFLLEKIRLLSLMEMTFKRPANSRQLAFDEISKAAQVDVNDVELLVMKALSLDLVRGSIDQVEQKCHMTWVQPRVLDLEQIGIMQQKLKLWCEEVKSMEMMVEVKAHDILDMHR